jgi:hypothetical protein
VEEEIVVNAESTKNLKSLIESPHEDFRLGFVYFLEVDNSLDLFVPAITYSNEIVLTTDREILSEIQKIFPDISSKITKCLGYMNDKLGIVYFVGSVDEHYLEEVSIPLSLFSKKKLEEMIGDVEFETKDRPVFKWRKLSWF